MLVIILYTRLLYCSLYRRTNSFLVYTGTVLACPAVRDRALPVTLKFNVRNSESQTCTFRQGKSIDMAYGATISTKSDERALPAIFPMKLARREPGRPKCP